MIATSVFCQVFSDALSSLWGQGADNVSDICILREGVCWKTVCCGWWACHFLNNHKTGVCVCSPSPADPYPQMITIRYRKVVQWLLSCSRRVLLWQAFENTFQSSEFIILELFQWKNLYASFLKLFCIRPSALQLHTILLCKQHAHITAGLEGILFVWDLSTFLIFQRGWDLNPHGDLGWPESL